MNIWFATNNSHKKEELGAILNITLKIPSEEGLKFNPDESGTTFYENTLIKARELKKLISCKDDIVIADDSGLCVDALDGRPGVYSARYGEKEGKKLTGMEQNLLLLEELGEETNRSCRFVCSMVLLFDENRFYIVQETLEGEIVKNKEMIKGSGGFGYDPVFFVPQYGKTVAELSAETKNQISHRGKAGRIIANIIRDELGKA
jgi:XTP/dITP diphosphohydrolase